LVPEAEMPAYLASVDVHVDPIGGRGGIGQTTRQVMSCGTAYVLSDTVGVRSVDCLHGLLFKQMDHRDLARKIVQLLRNEKLRKEIGEKSRKVALEIFDMEKTMKPWENVYHKLKVS